MQCFTFEYMEVCVLCITHVVCITYVTSFVWLAMSYLVSTAPESSLVIMWYISV